MLNSMPEADEQTELSCEDRQPTRGHTLKQANQLTVARYLLGEQEQKLLLYAISMIDPKAKQFARYRIEISAYAAACGIDGHALNKQLWDAAQAIGRKPLIILNHKDKDGKVGDLCTHWFSEVFRTPGYIEVTFPPSLTDYLVDVQKRFFLTELGVPLRFKGEYAIRLYQWLKSWQFRGSKEIPLTELRVVLGLIEWDAEGNVLKERLNAFGELKKWALLPALAQINKSSDISVGMREVKQPGSKRVEAVAFTILENPAYVPDPTVPRLPGVRVAAPVDSAAADLLGSLQTEFGLTLAQARQAIVQHGVEYVRAKAAIVRQKPRQNAAAALISALRGNWQPAKSTTAPTPPKKAAPAPAPGASTPEVAVPLDSGSQRLQSIKKMLAPRDDQGRILPAAATADNQPVLPL